MEFVKDRALSIPLSLFSSLYSFSLPLYKLATLSLSLSLSNLFKYFLSACDVDGNKSWPSLVLFPINEQSKHALTKQNNTLCCCLVGDSGDCKESPHKCLQNHCLFSFQTHRPSIWYYLLILGQRDKEVVRKAKSR